MVSIYHCKTVKLEETPKIPKVLKYHVGNDRTVPYLMFVSIY